MELAQKNVPEMFQGCSSSFPPMELGFPFSKHQTHTASKGHIWEFLENVKSIGGSVGGLVVFPKLF